MKKWLVVLFVFLSEIGAFGQQYWSQVYPNAPSVSLAALGIWPVENGGTLAARTFTNTGGIFTYELFRLDQGGAIQSVIRVPEDPGVFPEIYQVIRLKNGDILFIGVVTLAAVKGQYLRRIKSDGTPVWSKSYPVASGTAYYYGVKVLERIDSQLVVLCTGQQNQHAFLNYYDPGGNFLKTVDLPDSLEAGYKCELSQSGPTPEGYWVISQTKFDSTLHRQLLFYNPDGGLLWQKKLVGQYDQFSVKPTAGKAVGITNLKRDAISHIAQLHVQKIDSTGREEWDAVLLEFTFTGSSPAYDGRQLKVEATPDAGFIGIATSDNYQTTKITYQPTYTFGKLNAAGTRIGQHDFLWPVGIRFHSFNYRLYPTQQGDVLAIGFALASVDSYIQNEIFAVKMDSLGFFRPHRIMGTVRMDPAFTCSPGPLAPPLEGCILRLDQAGALPQFARTDSLGRFFFEANAGIHTLTAIAPGPAWKICTASQTLSFTGKYDTVAVGFSAQPTTNDPVTAVDVVMPELKRCQTKTMDVHYANQGILATDSTLIWVLLDPDMQYVSADVSPQRISGDTLQFRLKGLLPGARSKFKVKARLACNLASGQVQTLRAWATVPHLDVFPAGWSGSDLQVSGACQPDSMVRFSIRNEGDATSGVLTSYQVLHNHFIIQEGVLPPLVSGQSVLREFTADPGYWRLEIKQENSNPWGVYASEAMQDCNGAGSELDLPLLFAANDNTPFKSVESRANDTKSGSNELVASPVGYGTTHLVRQEDEIEYTFFFRNETDQDGPGVRITDTLSEWVDMSSFRMIAASHPYQCFLSDERALRIDFPTTNLSPDFLYPLQSSGYIRFRVRLQPNTPLGTRIENRGKVWMGYTGPRYSNTVFHTVGEPLLSVPVKEPLPTEAAQLDLAPNPAAGSTTLRLIHSGQGQHHLMLNDFSGRVVRQADFMGDTFELNREGLPNGFYLITITSEQGGRVAGKVVFTN